MTTWIELSKLVARDAALIRADLRVDIGTGSICNGTEDT